MILPLTGQQYSEKVSENCVAIWKSLGIYTEAEAEAIDKFVSIFKDETFPPGSSILFTVLPKGSLLVSDYYVFKVRCCCCCHASISRHAMVIPINYPLSSILLTHVCCSKKH